MKTATWDIQTCVEESALMSGEKDYTKTVTIAMALLGKGESRVQIGTSTPRLNSTIQSQKLQQNNFQKQTKIQIFLHKFYCLKQELRQ